MHQTEIRMPWGSLCRRSESTDSRSNQGAAGSSTVALCLRHLTLVGGEEEKVVVEGKGHDCILIIHFFKHFIKGVHCCSSSPPISHSDTAKLFSFGT